MKHITTWVISKPPQSIRWRITTFILFISLIGGKINAQVNDQLLVSSNGFNPNIPFTLFEDPFKEERIKYLIEKALPSDTSLVRRFNQAYIDDNQPEILSTINKAGYTIISQSGIEEGCTVFELNLELWKTMGRNDSSLLGDIYNNLGASYYYQGDIDKALGYFEYINKRLQKHRTPIKRANNYLNMAYVYNTYEDFPKTLDCYKKAKHYFDIENSTDALFCNMGMAEVYFMIDEKEKAKEVIRMAYEEAKAIDNKDILHKCYLSLASIYIDSIPLSREYMQKAIDLSPSSFTDYHFVDHNRILAKIESQDKNFDEAEKILKQSLMITEDKGMYYERFSILKELATIYNQQNNFEEALKYTQTLTSLQDSIAKASRFFKNNWIKLSIDAKQGRHNLQMLKKSNNEQKNALYWQKFTIMILIGFVMGAILSFYYLIKTINKARSRSRLLSEQNEIIMKQKQELTEMNDSRNKIISILSHDFRSPLNNIIGLIEMANSGVIDKYSDEFEDFLERIKNTSIQYQKLLETTLLWAKAQHNAFEIKKDPIDLSVFFIGLHNNLNTLAKEKDIMINIKEEDIDIMGIGDSNVLQVIVINLVNNAIKFSSKNSKIDITVKKEADRVLIAVQDYGIGIPKDIQEHLFDTKRNTQRAGTDGETGSGFGLTICKELSKAMSCDLYFQSKEGKGSIFFLSLPAANE